MYDPSKIEPKWQKYWEENKTFKSEVDLKKEKYYVLDMFPYPSGAGLHVGHPEGYTATDIICRYKRMKGLNVLHPMGWDAFGLPAENYAIKTGRHPRDVTDENIKTFSSQLENLRNRQVDGLLLTPPINSTKILSSLISQKIPFVIIDRVFENLNANSVNINNHKSAYDATTRLIKYGRKKSNKCYVA